MMEEKEVSAEFGSCAPVAIMKRIQVFGSRAVCQAWYGLKWLFLMPCRFPETRSTAMVCWSGVRNLAVVGGSGIEE